MVRDCVFVELYWDTNILKGNIIKTEKKKKLTSSELRKKKKERMARRKRGEEVFSDEDD
jgi:hypothetical protein